ncbi:MAG: DsbA family protein, partial [Gammaproteobacteria bacterium]|nr:DsbA family protein [Gammaproteobacteria bacterium]
MKTILIYVHDPMCSWCWGFTSVYDQLIERLPAEIDIRRLVGGLAPDSDVPMPEPMRQILQQTWARIEQMIPGKKFNFDFWSQCEPRRSTYPACRAVIAARAQGEQYDLIMTRQIQQAYYQQARNPSDNDTLIELSSEIGLDTKRFANDLVGPGTHALLLDEINQARSNGIDSFPSLMLEQGNQYTRILSNYTDV